ncbi:MAG: UDP-N-acetylglucosamine diphosphorylase/glucosamine-1-phosphate N-acetyltransferase [Dehalococcoidia bacterium]|nr:UDP-N-acetylglucosamine diphosphorylase/glucosamine-1-phosphate N-acetyltransferase [Dehalococcoidia bacterium]
MEGWSGVVLAAGKGTRMHSHVPKVLHPLCGMPMVRLVVDALREAGVGTPVVVVPPQAQAYRDALGDMVCYAEQREARGTGDAVAAAFQALDEEARHLLVVNGDLPLIRPETLRELMVLHLSQNADITFVTAHPDKLGSQALGKVLRDASGTPVGIVEAAQASEEVRKLTEVNVGVYCLRIAWAKEAIDSLRPSPGGEVYLTGLVELAHRQGMRVAMKTLDAPLEGMGVNTRVELAQAEGVLRQRIREHWMLQGVGMMDPATVYIDRQATIGLDTLLYPHTFLLGKTSVGAGCAIGPGTILRDTTIGDQCKVEASVVEGAVLEEGVEVGPFSHLRPETYVEAGVHIGNYAEVKQSRLGRGVKMGHFSYVGDATIGANVNIGAGTITCNFDGVEKHQTVVEEDVFLGSDTLLVAPVRVGAGAATGAGAVVVRDVPPGTLVVGMPARAIRRRTTPESKT